MDGVNLGTVIGQRPSSWRSRRVASRTRLLRSVSPFAQEGLAPIKPVQYYFADDLAFSSFQRFGSAGVCVLMVL